MSYCPECGAAVSDGATECFQCQVRLDLRLTAVEVRRQARRGALQGALIAGAGIIGAIVVISMLIQACVR